MQRNLRDRLGPNRRQSSTPHYQTFPTAPPAHRGKPIVTNASDSSLPMANGMGGGDDDETEDIEESPLPTKQLIVLALIALAEQTDRKSVV